MGIVRVVKNIRETVVVPDGTVERFVPSLTPECQPLQDGHIHLAGLSDAVEGYVIERRSFGVHEVLFSLAGAGRMATEGKSRDILPGEVFIAPAHTRYRYECAKAPWRFAWFQVKDAGLWRTFRTMPAHVRESHVDARIEGVMMRLLAECMGGEARWARMTTLLSEQVILYLEREFAVDESPHERRIRHQLEDLWGMVSGRLDKPWSVTELAERINMSATSFYRSCMRFTGLNPHRMLLKLRMQRAEELLMNHDYPLKSIAEMLGYGTPYAFSNAFKRYHAMSPRQYRAQKGV